MPPKPEPCSTGSIRCGNLPSSHGTPISNVYYVVASRRSAQAAHEFIADLPSFVEVARTGTAAMRYAVSLPMADFEDALQVAAASACGARSIVTRNVRDFARSPIPAITPAEALARLTP